MLRSTKKDRQSNSDKHLSAHSVEGESVVVAVLEEMKLEGRVVDGTVEKKLIAGVPSLVASAVTLSSSTV